MKVIFSRKGVDSAAGGMASPLVDGRPISVPIPDGPSSPTPYALLAEPLASLAHDLSNGRLAGDRLCHLDPDLDHSALADRAPGWRGSLGQAGSALSHLRNQGVGIGDLFIFWGLYRPVRRHESRWIYCGPRQHSIFGWLMIGNVLNAGADGSHLVDNYPWLRDHPHARAGRSTHNRIFIAADHFKLGGRQIVGSGVLRQAVPLSVPGSRLPSRWQVPDWLNPLRGGTGLSYHSPARFEGNQLHSAARGQEFVADIGEREDARDWLTQLLGGEP